MSASNDAIHARLQTGLEVLTTEVRESNKSVNDKISSVPKMWHLIVLIVTAAAGTLGILIAVLAFGGDRFDGGVSLSASSIEQSTVAKQIAQDNNKKLDDLTVKIDTQSEKMNAQWSRVEGILPALEALAKQTKASGGDKPALEQ